MKIFLSSVQKELDEERRAVKAFIENDPLLRRFFSVFLFENLPAIDQRADAVYLAEVDRCAVYLGLFGNDYGFEDNEGLSPTEREFDRATIHWAIYGPIGPQTQHQPLSMRKASSSATPITSALATHTKSSKPRSRPKSTKTPGQP